MFRHLNGKLECQTIELKSIEEAIHNRGSVPASMPAGMQASSLPQPYIAPKFQVDEGSLETAEVVIVKAHAAMGKSVTARYLSATRNGPLFDMSKDFGGKQYFSGVDTGWIRIRLP